MDGRTGVAGFPQGRRETVENTPRTPPGTRSPRRAHVERLVRHRTDETIGLRTLVLRCGPALRCGSLLTALDMRKPPRYGGCRAKPALADLFTDVLVLCARAGVVSVGLVAVDGSLIAANASRQATKSYRAVREEVERILQQAADADAEDDERFGDARGDELPPDLADPRSRRERLRRCKQQLEAEQAQQQADYEANLAWRAYWEAEHGRKLGGRKPQPPALASVGQQHLGPLVDAGGRELAAGRGKHRLEMPEVGADRLDLGGQHDLVLVGDRLRVVALQEPEQSFDAARVGVGDIDAPLRCGGRLVGVRRPAETPAVLHPPARPIGLVGPVGAQLSPELLLQAPLGLPQALRAATRHRRRVRGPLGLQALLDLAQPAATALGGRELRRQLVTARLAVELILGRVNGLGLLEDLARKLLVVEVLVARRVGLHLRPVDTDHADLREPAARAERQHLANRPAIAS